MSRRPEATPPSQDSISNGYASSAAVNKKKRPATTPSQSTPASQASSAASIADDSPPKKRRLKRGPDGKPIRKKRRPAADSAVDVSAASGSASKGEGALEERKRKPKLKRSERSERPEQSSERRPAVPQASTPPLPSAATNGVSAAKKAVSGGGIALETRPPRKKKRRSADERAALAAAANAREEESLANAASKDGSGKTEKFRAFGAVSLSMIIHAGAIIALALVMLPFTGEPDAPELSAMQERPQDELQEMLDQRLTPSESNTMVSAHSAIQVGHNSTIDGSTDPTVNEELSERLDGPTYTPGPAMNFSGVRGSDLNIETSDDAPGDPHAVVDGYDEAMDRITQEILTMLAKSKVLVVWVFDQSESMKDDQQEISSRILKVYDELGLRGVTDSEVLLTGVTSYGNTFLNHTPKATSNVDAIRKAIDAVPLDTTGKEMMCDAVGATIQQYKSIALAGRRQLAVILVTDESGDQQSNVTKLEAALYEAKSARGRIYILGREAVFGYPYAHMFWRHPQTGHIHLLPIDRGPETPFAEQLQTNGFHRRTDAHPSGFGPYEQCRLARETGGIFFMLPTIEANLVREGENTSVEQYRRKEITKEEYLKQVGEYRRYAIESLRPYLPSLESRQDYALERGHSVLRSTVWKVISDLNPYDEEKAKIIEVRTSDFSPNPATFANQVKLELTKARLYVEYLHAAEQAMELLSEERRKEIYPRWQANYDLIFAQILAYKVRIYEYQAYLQHFMKEPKIVPLRKEDPKMIGHYSLAHWHIANRQETITGELTAAYIERSRKMFEKIKEEHAGTPWAERAELELSRGFGVELMPQYHFHDPRPRKPGKPGPPRIPVPKI